MPTQLHRIAGLAGRVSETCRRAAEYETVTFGDMVRGVTDEGDFDDHFSAEDYDRRRYQRDGWGTVPGDRWV